MVTCAGVVLAGGRSTRMGTPKAALEWHGSTLLYRAAGLLSRVTEGPVVVVRAPGQDLPDLPAGTLTVDDSREGQGPVQGIAAGLGALRGRADIAFVSGTDMPLLHPAFVRRVLRVLQDSAADIALPFVHGFRQPLAAGYRVRLGGTAERLVARGRLRPDFLFGACTVVTLDEAMLRQDPVLAAADPDLDSVLNVNTPADYRAARARPAPEVTVQVRGAGPRTVRAATVGAAARAVGLTLGRYLAAVLDSGQVGRDVPVNRSVRITRDGLAPLAPGDTVIFRPAETGG